MSGAPIKNLIAAHLADSFDRLARGRLVTLKAGALRRSKTGKCGKVLGKMGLFC